MKTAPPRDAPEAVSETVLEAPHRPGQHALARAVSTQRPTVRGKFLFMGDQKFHVRGVTYGTFAPDANGANYPAPKTVKRDFELMVDSGVNTVRTYTVPPRWFLDLAQQHRLRVIVGLAWEQHVAFLDEPHRAQDIARRVTEGVLACSGHPAVLCYTVGNEIPASIVRWHGQRAIERFIKRLYRAAKCADPTSLVTYVNFPTTEYLDLSFLDFVAFNVYLEGREQLETYLPRLHNIAGDRPVVLTELGIDSRRFGEHGQAHALDWQIRSTFAGGCAGAVVFAWTDEWHRAGSDVEGWDFGLTDRARRPKPALASVSRAFDEVPCAPDTAWPLISVVVCSYNGARTIGDCLDGLRELDYPALEVIVVDDGSTDATAEIARAHGHPVISTPNRGLSCARNTGTAHARGEIIAFLDDDARPDPHWLQYLAASFLNSDHAAIGGPNIAPPGDGWFAECVANAPGGPVHVLLDDQLAEHIPGCNMAIRTSCLQAIGGFDPQFRTAGDDVDVCWRLQEHGWTLGFSPAAIVWHHRRGSLLAYWKQQVGYGMAEARLERKWPEKYNSVGHLTWQGRLYGRGLPRTLGWWRRRIYHGTWNSAAFQSVYSPTEDGLWSVPLMPEWYLLVLILAAIGLLGGLWEPLRAALGLAILALAASLVQAALSAAHASFSGRLGRARRLHMGATTLLLHLIQPAARLIGRTRSGLTPFRERGRELLLVPRARKVAVWSEQWQAAETWIGTLEHALREHRVRVLHGGAFDAWDVEVRSGLFGSARLRTAVEEHGHGRQLVRFRTWPHFLPRRLLPLCLLIGLCGAALVQGAEAAAAVLAVLSALLIVYAFDGCAVATTVLLHSVSVSVGQDVGCVCRQSHATDEATRK